jgi:opacity protein-like surface antigen
MKKSLIGMLAVLMTGTGAFAADLYQPAEPAPYVDAPEIEVREASGWYLRGDVGYSFNKLRGAEFFQGGTALGLTDFRTSKLDDAFMGGVGVGYQINNYLRTDLTFDYMGKADFRGSTRGSCGVAGDCISTDIASLRAYSLMANAYVDFGTYGRITPYAGAGIGGSYVKWGNLKNTSCEVGDPTNCDTTTEHGGKGSWRFAYALMAGASIDVTCNVKADVGYRFRHITKGDMFGFANGSGPGKDKGLYSHEVRVGGRYVFGGCETAQYMEPAPIPVEPAVYK